MQARYAARCLKQQIHVKDLEYQDGGRRWNNNHGGWFSQVNSGFRSPIHIIFNAIYDQRFLQGRPADEDLIWGSKIGEFNFFNNRNEFGKYTGFRIQSLEGHPTPAELYTDGSKNRNTATAACVWKNPNSKIWSEYSRNLGPDYTIAEAELRAIAMATQIALPRDHWSEEPVCTIKVHRRPFIILSDSQTAISKILEMQKSGWAANTDLVRIAYTIGIFNLARVPIGICWIKGHAGNEGNEQADKVAKMARKKDQLPPIYDYFSIIARDKELRKKARSHIGYGEGKMVKLRRKTMTAYTYLRTDKGPFKNWLHQINKADSKFCDIHHHQLDNAEHRLTHHFDELEWKEKVLSWEGFDKIPYGERMRMLQLFTDHF
jgi:ribonuclease HI